MSDYYLPLPEGKCTNSRRLRVFYGWSRIGKIRKRKAISVIFENGRQPETRTAGFISRMQNTVYCRYQTESEALDALGCCRMFTEFSVFIDDGGTVGSLEVALAENLRADSKVLSADELHVIMDRLRSAYGLSYG